MDLDGSILVADAHGLMRTGIVHILRTHFLYEDIVEVSDQAEFLGVLNASFDIAFLAVDLALLGPDYVKTVRELRLRRPSMKLLVLTSHVDRSAMFQLLSAGIHGYALKDLPPSELLVALETVARGQIYIPAQISNAMLAEQQHPNSHVIDSSNLTSRQHEVLQLLALGQSNKQIARALNIAEGTVKVHVNGLFRALGVHNRVGAVTATAHVSRSSAVVNYARRATDRIHLLLLGGLGVCFQAAGDVVASI